MNLRSLFSFFTRARRANTSSPSPQYAPESAAGPCGSTHNAGQKQVIARPFSIEEIGRIAGVVDQMGSVGRRVKPCSPAPSYSDAVEEVRRERLAEGPLDTRNADKAIDMIQAGGCAPAVAVSKPTKKPAVAPIKRKAALKKACK